MNESIAQRTTLKNGVKIVTKTIPHVRSVSMGIWVNTGARDEARCENGLSHFIEHMIFKGTKNRTALEIAKEFDAIGGHTNAFTAMENTCYYAKALDTHLDRMADTLSDIFLNSLFDEHEIDKERDVIFQEIGLTEDNPEDYIHLLSNQVYWGDTPLGRSILGTPENILKFNGVALKKFFRAYYYPERIIVSAAGHLDHDRFLDRVGPFFESIAPADDLSTSERVVPETRPGVTLRSKDLEQVHICLTTSGLSITDPMRYAYSFLNTITGGNMSSRLFQEVREKAGLAYSIYSFITSYVDTGMMGVYTAVKPERAVESVEIILKELKKIADRGLDAGEIADAAQHTKGGFLLASESVDNQMVRLAQNEMHFGRDILMHETIENIDSVVMDDVVGLARELFMFDKMALTLLGPAENKTEFERLLSV